MSAVIPDPENMVIGGRSVGVTRETREVREGGRNEAKCLTEEG